MLSATRGNVFLKQDVVQQAVCDPVLGDKVCNKFFQIYLLLEGISSTNSLNLQVEKNVFVVFYSGERAKNIVKVIPICFDSV